MTARDSYTTAVDSDAPWPEQERQDLTAFSLVCAEALYPEDEEPV